MSLATLTAQNWFRFTRSHPHEMRRYVKKCLKSIEPSLRSESISRNIVFAYLLNRSVWICSYEIRLAYWNRSMRRHLPLKPFHRHRYARAAVALVWSIGFPPVTWHPFLGCFVQRALVRGLVQSAAQQYLSLEIDDLLMNCPKKIVCSAWLPVDDKVVKKEWQHFSNNAKWKNDIVSSVPIVLWTPRTERRIGVSAFDEMSPSAKCVSLLADFRTSRLYFGFYLHNNRVDSIESGCGGGNIRCRAETAYHSIHASLVRSETLWIFNK